MKPVPVIIENDILSDFNRAGALEWLSANGLGGYASSTVIGCNTRRYHGLLVSALNPPLQRTVMLSKIEEEVVTPLRSFPISTNKYPNTVHPKGHIFQKRFSLYPFPTFLYELQDAKLDKTVVTHFGHNGVLVRYRLLAAVEPVELYLRPLVNCRDFHGELTRNDWPFNQSVSNPADSGTDDSGHLEIEAYYSAPILRFLWNRGKYFVDCNWYNRFEYEEERKRGLNCYEDVFNPGYFHVELKPGEEFFVYASTEDVKTFDPDSIMQETESHRQAAILNIPDDPLAVSLALAADSFVVRRDSTESETVIAGYHWFNDWGRDTMIAIPGLCLATGRFGDAKEILNTFARYIKDGLAPNTFPDGMDEPFYNTVDASLWLFWTVFKYLEYTRDFEFVIERMLPAMESVIEFYAKGTHNNIRMDPQDGLIWAGDENTQLTWMDAKVGDWVVTSRHGKAVEVNALWHNALIVTRYLMKKAGKPWPYGGLIEKTKKSFNLIFWNLIQDCLYDVVGKTPDSSIRCNQIIAVGLPFPILDEEREEKVVRCVYEKLWAPFGVRSLESHHPAYKGFYGGNQYERDGAYHQGTVWTWPLGLFITAWARVYRGQENVRERINKEFIGPFRGHLWEAGLGTVSEIFDGDPPHAPKGCISQAWSVAAVLRSYVEDVLGIRPPFEAEINREALEAI